MHNSTPEYLGCQLNLLPNDESVDGLPLHRTNDYKGQKGVRFRFLIEPVDKTGSPISDYPPKNTEKIMFPLY